MKVAAILDFIDHGQIALPEFQRGYVWNRDQVRSLMQSLYRRFPVGSLLVWTTRTESTITRGDGEPVPGVVKLLLDGQQRISTLHGIIRGKPPRSFDGNARAFTGLHVHLGSETFAFFSPLKTKDDPLWTDVTQLMREGAGAFIARVATDPAYTPKLGDYIARLNAVDGIKQIELHLDDATGEWRFSSTRTTRPGRSPTEQGSASSRMKKRFGSMPWPSMRRPRQRRRVGRSAG